MVQCFHGEEFLSGLTMQGLITLRKNVFAVILFDLVHGHLKEL